MIQGLGFGGLRAKGFRILGVWVLGLRATMRTDSSILLWSLYSSTTITPQPCSKFEGPYVLRVPGFKGSRVQLLKGCQGCRVYGSRA